MGTQARFSCDLLTSAAAAQVCVNLKTLSEIVEQGPLLLEQEVRQCGLMAPLYKSQNLGEAIVGKERAKSNHLDCVRQHS